MRKALASLTLLGSLIICSSPAQAAFPNDVFGGAVQCTTVPANTPTVGGQRWCGSDGGQATPITAVPSFDGTPIDVQVILPPAPASGPDGNFPVIGVFHGYGGQKSTKTDATNIQRWVTRGYAVFNPTTRGFWGSCGVKVPNPKPPACDNGFIHLMNVGVEVRDAQYLLGLLADDGAINPSQIGVTGQSYGGGMSMQLAALKNRIADPNGNTSPWTSPGGKPMSIAAAAPEFGWSDLSHSLVPNGSFYDYAALNPYRGPNGDRRIGVQKLGWVERLYAGGQQTGYYSTNDPYDVPGIRAALSTGGPYDGVAKLENAVDQLSSKHSAFGINDSVAPSPTLLSQGWNDDLFPVSEALRYYNKVREHHPESPINLWAFDWGHTPRSAINTDNATSLFAAEGFWMDHYVRGVGGAPDDAAGGVNAIASGCADGTSTAAPTSTAVVHAKSWADLAKGELKVTGPDPVTIPAATTVAEGFQSFGPNPPATTVCTTSGTADTPGAAVYTLGAKQDAYTLAGAPTVLADLTVAGANDQLVARLYDVNSAASTERLIARGVYRPKGAGSENAVFQLSPQMWTVQPGHELKLELLTTDSPFVRNATGQNPVDVDNVELRVPTRNAPGAAGGAVTAPAAKVVPPGYTLARDFQAQVTPTPTPTVTPTPTSTYVIPTPTPTPPTVKKQPGLTAKAKPDRDKKKPFKFTVKGKLKLPSGVSKAAGCKGKVAITGKKGKKTLVKKKKTSVKSDCTYKANVKLNKKKAGKKGKVKFTVKFGGNSVLKTKTVKTSAKYGKK
jgi:fermentation-respiration switch protein FrsA (DUF1100 family)